MNLAKIKNHKTFGFFVRLGLFLVLYALIFTYHSEFTSRFLGYKQSFYQPYFIYLMYPVVSLFVLFRWKQLKEMEPIKNKFWQTLLFSIAAITVFLLPLRGVYLFFGDNVPGTFIYYYPLFLGFIFLFCAIFNVKFIKKFSSELFLLTYVITLYTASDILLESLWIYFSGVILSALAFVLPLFSKLVTIDPSQLLVRMEKFEVIVGATCSGIYSMVTFSFLFVAALMMIKKKAKINSLKAALALFAGLVVLFILNIIRIAIIVSVGAFYSPELAINLFHEYLSAIFLLSVFIAYLYHVFPRIILPQVNADSA